MRGVVAIVGRPNVGKSTLFNRLVRQRGAIVADSPGVTRDRIYGAVEDTSEGVADGFILIDTGGFAPQGVAGQPVGNDLIWEQALHAMAEADLVVLLLDGRVAPTPDDLEILRAIRRLDKPFVVAANKIDGPEHRDGVWDFLSLGVPEIETLSAAHNRGTRELRDTLAERLAELNAKKQTHETDGYRVAIVGRPNVGKSSILNRLVGRPRALVSDVPGTTRDCIDIPIRYNQASFVLVDTAGIRRKARIYQAIESQSVTQSLRAIDRADLVALVLDATQGLTDQDARLADLAISIRKPLLFVVNKWDLVPEKHSLSQRDFAADLHASMKACAYAPVVFTSALHNRRVHLILEHLQRLAQVAARRVSTTEVNDAIKRIVHEHSPALIKPLSKRVKFYYGTQVSASPPKFIVFCNVADDIQESYRRYVEHRLRDLLGFDEIPLHVVFRGRKPREHTHS